MLRVVLIRNASLLDGRRVDVAVRSGRVERVGASLERRPGERELAAQGGALLPGLHDHHLHLYALARARSSVPCGPPAVRDRAGLARALAHAAAAADEPGGWIRGIAYHDSVAGPLDRHALETLCPGRPLRVQYRTGSMWVLNSTAVRQLGLDGVGRGAPTGPSGIERDARGRVTGRLFRLDDWLRARLPDRGPPSLDAVSRLLAAHGVTGVTDATPSNDADTLARLVESQRAGGLRQRVLLMGSEALEGATPEGTDVRVGALKLMLDDAALPDLEATVERVRRAHRAQRSVAVHCVTRGELVFALSAFALAGTRAGDRIEHASVAPDESLAELRAAGLRVVTQPGFVAERGDEYLRDVDPVDLPCLYRLSALDAAGVPLAAGSDAPFGEPDPWAAMRAAVERRTRSGRPLGRCERVSPERALALFTTPAEAPGAAPSQIREGAIADLVLLDVPWSEQRSRLESGRVRLTLRSGRVVHE